MKQLNWNEIIDKINARSGRERLLMMLVILTTLHMTTFYSIQPELIAQQSRAAINIDLYQNQIEKRSHDIHNAVNEYKQDSDSAILKSIAGLNRQLNQTSDRLSEIPESFVSPLEMSALIRALLSEHDLHIHKLENSPPEALSSDKNEVINIYKHGLYIETSGSYHNQIRFLTRLEQLPWHIFWNELDLQANEAGKSTVGLNIYTLNYEPVWLEI